MLYLVRDIQDYSQLESRTFMLNTIAVNITDLIDECIGILKFKAEEKRIELDSFDSFNKKSALTVMTDGNRVKQILINLLSNAIKYT